ncbi:hypothetical protein [Salinispora arenicola]|uniref:hypothetical protein n=1 Tax=Salinispora arenicola TaxID=168697 RepID=UPI00047F83EA|nr:hypothetical protein [Salinispora arenicola]
MLQVVAAAGEPFETDLEIADALAAGVGVESTGFERGQVAVHRVLGLFDLPTDGGEFCSV